MLHRRTLIATAASAGFIPAAPAILRAQELPGVTATEIRIGNTIPYSGNASAYGTSREIAIPWSAITGGRKPAAFSFLGYITTGDGFVYAQLPPENGSGKIEKVRKAA